MTNFLNYILTEADNIIIKKEKIGTKKAININGERVYDERDVKSNIESTDDETKLKLIKSDYIRNVIRYGRRLQLYKPGLIIKVDYPEQSHYSYKLKKQMGEWTEYPDFSPDLSPKEILCKGVLLGWVLRDWYLEFPKDWYIDAIKQNKIAYLAPSIRYNYYKIAENKTALNWRRDLAEDPKVITEDPYGWLQWYFRFYIGRRVPDVDRKQIRRWLAFRNRYERIIDISCNDNDENCQKSIKQAALCFGLDIK